MQAEAAQIFARDFLPCLRSCTGKAAFSSFAGSSDAFALAALAADPPGGAWPLVVAVMQGIPDAERIGDDLRAIAKDVPDLRILELPAIVEDDSANAKALRLHTISALEAYAIKPYPCVVVTSAVALEGTVENRDLALKPVDVAQFMQISPLALAEKLRGAGYSRVPEATGTGEYALRGGILDFWSPGCEYGVRVEFFGDEIDSVRAFDPATQVSTQNVGHASAAPIALASPGEIAQDAKPCKDIVSKYVRDAAVFYFEHRPAAPLAAKFVFYSGEPAPEGVDSLPFRAAPLPGFAELGMETARHPELLEARRADLARHIEAARKIGKAVVETNELGGGFETANLVVVTKSDRVFAARRGSARRGRNARHAGERFTDPSAPEIGELVVHVEHGIGRFLGSEEIVTSRGRAEMLAIEYAGKAKLYVPAAQAHLLSRYVGVHGIDAKLDTLGGRHWRKAKENAERSIRDLAASLLETQAKRASVPGFACSLGYPEIAAFEAAFPYEETPDQAQAIADVKSDMASTRPMDRLLCGDAGYGKTEVAMRAALIAAMNGRQTALLAPTTVLAEQHFETFLSRFEGTPVTIEALSRFQTPQARRGTLARLAAGTLDIVIGTHALLARSVRFRDLGLIIIDEEQRFGVRHKEHLKRLRTSADVLAMSATPIPRTLYLSMTGTRDLSQLRTPPRERTAVETIIRHDTDELVRNAIQKELARGGQVFYLYNRVRTIDDELQRLKALVPAARIAIAHAQMPTQTLATRMAEFARGAIDVLLCTTIIESGLDITRANTIIVHRADMFGLAELYQIRGRVGRGARQGYAYFLLPADSLVDADARERLAALKRHGDAGAGFNIALRDLELRGAGNLLGSEQSGHIAAVGFQLYCQLLRRAVARLQGKKVREIVDVTLNLDFIDLGPGTVDDSRGACLPYDYVEEESQRADIYRRLAECASLGEVRRLSFEVRDRFGAMPPAVKRLFKLTELRNIAAGRKISRIDSSGERVTIYGNNGDTQIASLTLQPQQSADSRIAAIIRAITTHD